MNNRVHPSRAFWRNAEAVLAWPELKCLRALIAGLRVDASVTIDLSPEHIIAVDAFLDFAGYRHEGVVCPDCVGNARRFSAVELASVVAFVGEVRRSDAFSERPPVLH